MNKFKVAYIIKLKNNIFAKYGSRIYVVKVEPYKNNGIFYTINRMTKDNNVTFTYQKKQSKSILDDVDEMLAHHYGFIEEGLNIIIIYDVEYCIGNKLNEEE